jgi:hypothetical protein
VTFSRLHGQRLRALSGKAALMTKYYDHKPDYLSLQANIICLLLFVIGVTAILTHPAWFR